MGAERRLHPRVNLQLAAEIRDAGRSGWERVLLVDISAGGCAVHAAADLPLQSEVLIRFSLPTTGEDDRELEASCLVVRVTRAACIDESLPVLIGLHFLSLAGEDFEYIRRWVWSRMN
jgi:c-di-GMP-binding flagellar brake protein YcgR